ncbi:MAG: hypothetical protein WEA04_00995 [Candidatus Andersenbacteria bacterium]
MIPPELIHLLADLQATRINQVVQVEEIKRRLNPTCYVDDDFGLREIHDAPSTTTSTSGASTTTTLQPLANSASFTQ